MTKTTWTQTHRFFENGNAGKVYATTVHGQTVEVVKAYLLINGGEGWVFLNGTETYTGFRTMADAKAAAVRFAAWLDSL